MRVLFLDDNKYRHEIMRRNSIGLHVDHVWNASEAIAALATGEYDLIMLDHDLDYRTENEMNDDEEDGRFVVRWMIENDNHREATIIIHSLNVPAAEKMELMFRIAKYDMTKITRLPLAWQMIAKDNDKIVFGTSKTLKLHDWREG